MAVDLKTGRGGLRALQAFEWESRREQLIGRFSSRHDLEADEARETLLQVRNALHSVTGRAHDLYSPELREAVARWLGRDAFEVAADLVTAMHSIDRLAEKKWPEVVEPPVERAQRRNRRRSGPAVSVRGDVAPTIDYLDRLLEAGDPGRAVFDELWEGGLLQDLLPEWGVVADLPQLEPFHQHPVDAHLWRTVDEMRSIIADDGHVGRIAGELGRPRLLRLAAFLHDIGKGHGGDHSRLGAEIAAVFAKRVALDRDEAEMLNRAVEHHLLLPITATRRDLADPAVIDQVSEEVGSLEMLQVLYLLTIADSRATGPTMWSAWKATLLRTLFLRCAARFGAAESEPVGTTREDVLSAAGGSVDPVIAHLDAMPDSYLQTVTVDEVLWHSQLANDLSGPCNLGVRDASPADAVAVVGAGAIGFRRTVSAVFAANGIDVLEARMFGRSDGLVVDSFRVRDDRTGGRVSRERWDRIRSDLDAGLRGELDADDRLAARAAAYPASDLSLPLPTAAVSTDPASGDLVVVVKCSDRIGRLAEILGVLEGHGLEIRLAKLDSREGEVIDTFHVAPVRSIADLDLDELGKTVAAEIEP
jgi:[protein-PII] uridylyltransferase